jgi:hypothetical protein
LVLLSGNPHTSYEKWTVCGLKIPLDLFAANRAYRSSPQEKWFGSSDFFLMESCAMDKLELYLWGMSLSAQGTTAIVAAFLIIALVVGLRFRK